MNCKPGEFAWIVQSNDERNFRKIVFVKRRCIPPEGVVLPPIWWCELQSEFHAIRIIHPAGTVLAINDSWLRPIRDPGEDARDETLLWLPVPSTVKEVA